MAMSCSNEYVPYLSVCIESILNVSDDTRNYDIIIFEQSISQHNKNKLTQQVKRKNFSLRFINPSNIINAYKLKFPERYAIECYFRLSSPELLCNYEKIIFTDVDLVFMNDPYLLYTSDIKDYPLGACKDLMFGAFLNYKNADWKDYCKYILKLEYPYEYFNTGVMLFNIKKLNEINFSKNILTIVSNTLFRILEQDGINFLFKNNIKYLDSRWNYPVESNAYKHIIADMPKDFKIDYKRCKNDPFVIHWAGRNKPWKFLDEEYAYIWWNIAKQSPFYDFLKKDYLKNIQFKDKDISY